MATDQWRQVESLFERAVELDPAERNSFLSGACGGDAELRAEVESLLECDRLASGDFMVPPQPDPDAASLVEETAALVGSKVGRYQIQRVIAAGGMGTVYEAVQEQPERLVALKVLHGSVASAAALRRFQFESQVLGRLHHKHIAQIFEAGIHQGAGGAVPYFAMEYVPGAETITAYCNDRQLGTRQRLELMAAVCAAVHHGHQKGIIHRDLKPANILVDEQGEPKVIDFGVARSTDADVTVATRHTQAGQLVGTMQYMSPEQCDADPDGLDIRSDVYSLGVLAYELLTGQPPYDASGTTIYRATRIIKEQFPRRPSEVNRKLRGNVETILLKALEKDRENRYQSAADLGRDIQRHVTGEPIEARPAGAWTRAVRWVLRHPFGATATSCLLMCAVAVAATFATVWFFNSQPADLILLRRPGLEGYSAGYAVELRTRNGRVMKTWPAVTKKGIVGAELVNRPAVLGGGKLALIGFTDRREVDFPRSLCAFDINGDLERPVWRVGIDESERLPDPHGRGYFAEDFSIGNFWIHDVFPERPGEEIVAIYHQGTYSQCFIRIYDLTGGSLFQVWYDGAIGNCEWLPRPRLLVFSGDNAEVDALRRGIVGVKRAHPFVVFAVCPEAGLVKSAFLKANPGPGALGPVWLRMLKPDNSGDVLDDWQIDTNNIKRGSRGASFRILLHIDRAASAEVAWEVDDFGMEVPRSRVVSDGYTRNLAAHSVGDPERLPDPGVFKLGDLPPIIDVTSRDSPGE